MRGNFLTRKEGKNTALKKKILSLCVEDGRYSIAELSKHTGTSVPTVTKLIGELIEEGFIVDLGKLGTSGGRRPSVYGLNPSAGYFIGVDVGTHAASIAVTDFKGELISYKEDIPFEMEAKEENYHRIADSIRKFFLQNGLDWSSALGCGISFTGRVNPTTGYSYSYSFDEKVRIDRLLADDLGFPVYIENDSRAMTYGEYLSNRKNEQNMLFINISWGLGMGLVLNKRLFYGKSGFSGEVGHFPYMDNDIICRCGKIGCLETGASGSALYRMVVERLKEGRASSLTPKFKKEGKISLVDILQAVKEEDVLAIEVVEEIGATLGRALAGLINIFNPEVVVIGGRLAVGGDYLMLPIKSTVRRLAQNFVAKDTTIVFTKLGPKAAPVGDCLIARSKMLDIL